MIFLPNTKHVIYLIVLPSSKILGKYFGPWITIFLDYTTLLLPESYFFLFPDYSEIEEILKIISLGTGNIAQWESSYLTCIKP
jgi:hypothetical protein